MQKLIIPHGSPADWDFNTLNWELTDVRFVSPPTSIRCTEQWGPNPLLKKAGFTCIPQGRIIADYFCEEGTSFYLRFNTVCVGPWHNWTGCYFIRADNTGAWDLEAYDAGDRYLDHLFNKSKKMDAWHKVLIQWWDSVNGYCIPSTAIQCANWETDHWDFSDIYHDTDRRFRNEGILRVGFDISKPGAYQDDFELWVPS